MDIKFNTEQMMNTAVAIEDDASNYQRIYEQLINAASTIGPAFDTPENRDFVDQIEGCTKELKAMVERLSATAQLLKAQANNYQEISDINKAQVRKLQN